jgi:PTH1 family peptidyl-tRNA hydrolase
VSDYVLSKPSPSDRQQIELAIDNMLRILPDVLSGNLDKAMNWLHSQ